MKPTSPKSTLDDGRDDLTASIAWLRKFARALVNDPNDADDLVQGALSAAVTSRRPIVNLRAFLAESVRRLAWNQQRATRHRADRERMRAELHPEAAKPPGDHLESMETMRAALDEVAKLPEAQAKAISLRFVEDLSIAEIAARLSITESSVRSNLARGLATVRGRLDKRSGGRSSWMLGLAPMVFPGAVIPAPPTLPTPAPLPLAATATTAATVAMSLKAAVALAVPVLAFLGYSRLTSAPQVAPLEPLGQAAEAGPSLDLDEEDALASLAPIGLPRLAEEPEAAAVPAPPAAAFSPSAAPLALSFVHLDDRSPLFEMEVIVTPVGGGVEHEPRTLRSDRDGQLVLEDLPESATGVELSSDMKNLIGRVHFAPSEVALDAPSPLGVPIEVFVMMGPTFVLDFSGEQPVAGTPMDVVLTGPGISAFQEVGGLLTWGSKVLARLPSLPPVGQSEGPWTLSVSTRDGMLLGEGPVASVEGTVAPDVPIKLHATGAVRFTAGPDFMGDNPCSSGRAPLPFVILEPTKGAGDGANSRAVQLTKGQDGIEALIGGLQPGLYTWNLGGLSSSRGVAISGEVQVHARETQPVELPGLGDVNRTREVIVDASEVLDLDVGQVYPGAASIANGGMLLTFQMVPAEDLGPGMWRVPIGPTPQPGWFFSFIVHDENVEVSHKSARFTEDGDLPAIRITPKSRDLTVRLTLQDAVTGETLKRLDGASAVYVDRLTPTPLRRGPRSSLVAKGVPSDRSGYFFCLADGYRMEEIPFEPGNSGDEMTVPMTRGWANLVVAIDLDQSTPYPGAKVIVDGEAAGLTDDAGRLWLEGSGPPKLIELELPDETMEVGLSPFAMKLLPSPNPTGGFRFGVKKR
jgi:RNA polymerase sigma-70 factor (ECF subfamily)